jgi:hypothetical protein
MKNSFGCAANRKVGKAKDLSAPLSSCVCVREREREGGRERERGGENRYWMGEISEEIYL